MKIHSGRGIIMIMKVDESEHQRKITDTISIKTLGGFSESYNKNTLELEIYQGAILREVLELLESKYHFNLNGYGSSFLVLINDIESNVLKGLETKIMPHSELTLIRVSHGG
jgi:molybdopterin converting factor small subunit